MVLHYFNEAIQNRRVSSKNCWWVNGSWDPHNCNPCSFPSATWALINLPKPSAAMMKRNGDRGSPCLRPLELLNGTEGLPFKSIEKCREDMNERNHWSYLSSNPKAHITSIRYCQLMRSYALDKSNLINRHFLLSFLRAWIDSCATTIPSKICLPFTKPICFGEISVGNRGFKRFTIIVERIL